MTDQTGSPQRTPAEIEAHIALQRQRLAATVDGLAAKLDVKTQAQDKVARLKDSATTETGAPRPEVLVAAGSFLITALVVIWWRRRR